MNAPEKIAFLPDIQSEVDNRDLRIDAVGINRVRYPMAQTKALDQHLHLVFAGATR